MNVGRFISLRAVYKPRGQMRGRGCLNEYDNCYLVKVSVYMLGGGRWVSKFYKILSTWLVHAPYKKATNNINNNNFLRLDGIQNNLYSLQENTVIL